MKVKKFIRWLEKAGSRGRTMHQFIQTPMGLTPIRSMLNEAKKLGFNIKVIERNPRSVRNKHRFILEK